jgi:hypothetical protein
MQVRVLLLLQSAWTNCRSTAAPAPFDLKRSDQASLEPTNPNRTRKAAIMTRSLTAIALPTALALVAATPLAAQASWLNLSDGQYAVDLTCTASTVIPCPSVIHGTLTIQGAQATAMNVTIDGLDFVGDPDESTFSVPQISLENSQLVLSPFSFLSLRYITSGGTGSFGTGDLWWVYCNNLNTNACTPATQGLWSATPLVNVPEPTPLALLAAALLASVVMLRRSRPG